MLTSMTALPVCAGTVYQYYDEQGAVTFSDTRPDHTDDFIVIDMPDPPVTEMEVPDSSLDELIAVTEELEALRREKEALANEEVNAGADRQERRREEEYYYDEDDENNGYIYSGYDYPDYGYYPDYNSNYGYPNHGGRPPRVKTTPPYKFKVPSNPAEKRLEELKTPIRIPQFNSNIPLNEQLKPYNPPPGPPRGRH